MTIELLPIVLSTHLTMAGVEDIESLAADPAYTRLTVQEAMKNRAEVLAAKAKYHEAYQRLITQGGLVLEKRKAHPWLSDDRVVLAAICGLLIILLIFFCKLLRVFS